MLAAAVALSLVITYELNVNRIAAWWLLPLLLIVTVGISLRRATRA